MPRIQLRPPSLLFVSTRDSSAVSVDLAEFGLENIDFIGGTGNLRAAARVSAAEYELVIEPDTNTTGHTQWFYFRVQVRPRPRVGLRYRLSPDENRGWLRVFAISSTS